MLVSIHIAKTGGTTLTSYLSHSFRRRIYYDYNESRDWRVERERIIEHKDFIEDQFEVIHGHITYKKYEGIFDNSCYISCLRHPVDRLISNYHHVLRVKDANSPYYRHMLENGLDILTFAEFPFQKRVFASILDGRRIQDYDFIGISERFADTIQLLSNVLGRKLISPYQSRLVSKTPIINRKPILDSLFMRTSKKNRCQLENVLREDMDIYKESYALFDKKFNELLKRKVR